MKLPVSVVRSFDDIQLNFEALAKVLTGGLSAAQVAFANTLGPLPISNTLTMRGGSVLALWAGSGSRVSTAGSILVDLYLDGVHQGPSSAVQANEVGSHKATVPAAALITVAQGSRTWGLRDGGTGDAFDSSDRFTLVLFELGS